MSAPVPWALIAGAAMLAAALAIGGRGQSARWRVETALLASLIVLTLLNPRWFDASGELEVATPGARDPHDVRWLDAPGYEGIHTPGKLPAMRPDARQARIYGAGLPAAALDEWPPDLPFAFQYSEPREGFHAMRFSREVTLGAYFEVTGAYLGEADRVSLMLGNDIMLAESSLADGAFALRFTPVIEGLLDLRLRAHQGARTQDDEPLGIVVAKPATLRVGLVLSRPDYTANALRRWLVAGGASGVAVTELAPGITREDRLNPAPEHSATLTPDEMDLWIGDTRTWTRDRDALWDAVNRGLSVLILASEVSDALPLTARAAEAGGPVPVALPEFGSLQTELLLEDPRATQFVGIPRHVAGYRKIGRGSVAVITLRDVHTLARTRGPTSHDRFWANILETLLPPVTGDPRHLSTDPLITVGQRVTTCSTSDRQLSLPPPVLLRRKVDGERCVDWWPQQPGWLEILPQHPPLYVYPAATWRTWRHESRRRDTRWHAALALEHGAQSTDSRRRLPQLWWWLLAAGGAMVWLREGRARGYRRDAP